jgi:hypothetical protein
MMDYNNYNFVGITWYGGLFGWCCYFGFSARSILFLGKKRKDTA